MSDSLTFKFRDCIPTLADFKTLLGEIPMDLSNSAVDLFHEYCYNRLMRKYATYDVRYDTKEAFLLEFANVYEDAFMCFYKEYEYITAMYNVTKEESERLQVAINNFANNPNDAPTDPLAPLNYISSQSYGVNLGNKLSAYAEALKVIPTLHLKEFLDNFTYLFMQVLFHETYIYNKEEEN